MAGSSTGSSNFYSVILCQVALLVIVLKDY